MSDKFHFTFDPKNDSIGNFVKPFIESLGNVPLQEADIIIPVGGDGSMLHAFHRAASSQRIFGIVPPISASLGYWLHRGINTSGRLLSALVTAQEYCLSPLRGNVFFDNGAVTTIRGFNEIVPGQSQGEHSDQTMKARLAVTEGGVTIASGTIEGGGLIVSTPYGSSAMNILYGGAIADLRSASIVMTGKGLRGPKGLFSSAVLNDDISVELTFLETEKRPVRMQYDGMKISADLANPINHIHIEKDSGPPLRLLLSRPPSVQVLAHIL